MKPMIKIRTRKGRLIDKIETELKAEKISVDNIILAVDDYEKDNLDTIEKLKKDKKVVLNKINGSLRQSIQAHGPITSVLIGSASKRIHGALLINPNESNDKRKISIRDVIIGIGISLLIYLFI